MEDRVKRWGGSVALGLLLSACAHRAPVAHIAPPIAQEEPRVWMAASSGERPPAAPREFRGLWVATVANLDWPSTPGKSTEAQKAEALEIITRARELGLNTLILQVRPAADALYPSSHEPWSEALTGIQGRAPTPAYDPLAFWVEASHQAGLDLHAWFNPYRARTAAAKSPLAPNHVANQSPATVKAYGRELWMDPSDPEAADRLLRVVLDVVRRYDIDGVHLDDYFYPYPVKDGAGRKVDFPDEPRWQRYVASGGLKARADWRREQVDRMVLCLSQAVHREKPFVRVGISPFGLGRPEHRPPGIVGFSQYDELYADAERWLQEGWVDYFMPQLYWRREPADQAFGPLLDYWRSQNFRHRHLWPGLYTSRVTGGDAPWPVEEMAAQITLSRNGDPHPGHAHFSASALKRDGGGIHGVLTSLYRGPALVPAAPWMGTEVPPAPTLRRRVSAGITRLEPAPGQALHRLAVWARYGRAWRFFVLSGDGGDIPQTQEGQPLGEVWVTAVGRTGLESVSVLVM